MDLSVRSCEADRTWQRVVFTAFGEELTDEKGQDELDWADLDRFIGAFDGDQVVGSAGAHSFELTLPGGAIVPVAGVTNVGVLPTHRRRGALRAMMRFQLDDVVERGEPMAILTASEASIYGRFGYGVATRLAKVRIDTRTGFALRVPCRAEGSFRLLQTGEVIPTLAPLHDAVRRATAGDILRPARWWDVQLRDRADWRKGASHRFDVVHTTGGVVDGAVTYRIRTEEHEVVPGWEVVVEQVLATDPEVELALFQYLSEIDLTSSITSVARPVDDWLPYRMVDARRYRIQRVYDHIYARVLDVERVLSDRTYGGEGTLVLEVLDDFRPASGGTFRLAGGSCERADGAAPDLTLDASTLGSLVLGDVAPSVLAAAGRIAPNSSDALRIADRLFPTVRAPFAALDF